MFRKYATLQVLESWRVPARASAQRLRKAAHRVDFSYQPRPGYIYVRSRAISSRTNDNHDSFPAEEIEKSYKTFLGKPAFVNHRNDNHRRARGVIVAVALHKDRNPDGSPDTWAECLHEIDAVTFPKLAKAILTGRVNRTSMGVDCEYSTCSACGNRATSPVEYCQHMPAKKGMKIRQRNLKTGKIEEKLVHEICAGLTFFENSFLVEDPADPTAVLLGTPDARGLHMSPRAASPDRGDGHVRHAVSGRNIAQPQLSAPGVPSSDRDLGQQFVFDDPDIIFGELGDGVLRSRKTAAFGDHIGGVDRVGAEKPVQRVHARQEVTRVADDHSCRDRSVGESEPISVRSHGRPLRVRQRETWIAAVEESFRPRAASARRGTGIEGSQETFGFGNGTYEPAIAYGPADHGAYVNAAYVVGKPDARGLSMAAARRTAAGERTDPEPSCPRCGSGDLRPPRFLDPSAPLPPHAKFPDIAECTSCGHQFDASGTAGPSLPSRRRRPGDAATGRETFPYAPDPRLGGQDDLQGSRSRSRRAIETWNSYPEQQAPPPSGPRLSSRRTASSAWDGLDPEQWDAGKCPRCGEDWMDTGSPFSDEDSQCPKCGTRYDAYTGHPLTQEQIAVSDAAMENLRQAQDDTLKGEKLWKKVRPGHVYSRNPIGDNPGTPLTRMRDLERQEDQTPRRGGIQYRRDQNPERYETEYRRKRERAIQKWPSYEEPPVDPTGREKLSMRRHAITGEQAEPGEDIFAKPRGDSPVYEHAMRELESGGGGRRGGGRDPLLSAPDHGPYYIIRDPDHVGSMSRPTDQYHVVDREGRKASFRLHHDNLGWGGYGSGHSGALDDWHMLTHHEDPDDYRHGRGDKGSAYADPVSMHERYRAHLQANPPRFPHSRIDPRDEEIARRPDARVARPEGYSPDEEWHGPYEVVRHPDTGEFHIVDNAGRKSGGYNLKFPTQMQAERSRDYIDSRQQSKERGKALADALWEGAHQVMDPGSTPEGRQSDRNLEDAQRLMNRYEGGLGEVKFDPDEEGGEPYYEREHLDERNRPTGWYAKHYGGPQADVYHRATGDEAHDMVSLPDDGNYGLKEPFGDEDFARELREWHDTEGGTREHLETERPSYGGNARIQRWKRRRQGARRTAGDQPVRMPPPVDTLRPDKCPVCGDSDVYKGQRCPVCGFVAPPDIFRDPDTGQAALNHQQLEDGKEESPLPQGPADEEQIGSGQDAGDQLFHPDQVAPDGVPGAVQPGMQDEQGMMAGGEDQALDENGQPLEDDAMLPEDEEDAAQEEMQEGEETADEGEQELDEGQAREDEARAEQAGEQEAEDEDADPSPRKGQDSGGRKKTRMAKQQQRAQQRRPAPQQRAAQQPPRQPQQHIAVNEALAAQQRVIRAQAAQIQALGAQMQFLGELAGVGPQLASLRRHADEMNPASPVPDPPQAPPTETTEQALAPETMGDASRPGTEPGSTTHVPAEMTTTSVTPGVEIQTAPATQLVDVTAPVQGTNPSQDGGVPIQQRRIETDVRIDPDPLKASGPGIGGVGTDGTAYPWVIAAREKAASVSRTASRKPQQQPTPEDERGARTFASIRLARLRKAAGLASGDELEGGARIERDASLSLHDIEHEIATLDQVTKAAAAQRPPSRPQRPQGTRYAPSMSAPLAPQMARTASFAGEPATDDAQDVFLD